MDGQRPMEELSETPNLSRVLKFRDAEEGDRVFVVDEILGPNATTTVLRVIEEEDGSDRDCRKLKAEEDWQELLAEILSSPEKGTPNGSKNGKWNEDATEKGDKKHSMHATSWDTREIKGTADSKARSLYIFARPEPGKQRLSNIKHSQPYADRAKTLKSGPRHRMETASAGEKPTTTIFGELGFVGGCRHLMRSFLQGSDTVPCSFRHNASSADDRQTSTPAQQGSQDDRKKLRNMPFTLKTFCFIVRGMSIHSWINRVISRADVQVFEQTVTQMPIYLNNGEIEGKDQAIIYNWRSSNAWANDIASTVTYFPRQKLTLGIVFGSNREQEESILRRFKKADRDVAHPVLLLGVLAEIERTRQMEAIEDTIDELETQIFLLNSETVSTRNNNGSSKAQRNKKKTEVWLNATFARNSLLSYKSMLIKMRKNIIEFPRLASHLVANRDSTQRRQRGYGEPGYRESHFSEIPHTDSWGSTQTINNTNNRLHNAYDSGISRQSFPDEELLNLEPEMMLYGGDEYQEIIHQAGMRMRDRLVTMIEEYDDKIRDFTMRIDNMAMATQWSQGETNMEIATSSAEDSSQMRSIALVTMVFLPGTFFASIFSMTFFNWTPASTGDNQTPIVSEKIWIYFLVTGIFTIITLALFWYFVLHRQKRRKSQPRDDGCPA